MLRRFVRSIPLIALILQYFLGFSTANYLGNRFQWSLLISGFVWLFLVYIGSRLLAFLFSEDFDQNSKRFPEPFRHQPRIFIIALAVFVFLLGLSLSILQINEIGVTTPLILIQTLIAIYFIFESVPPVAIKKTIFSEFGFALVYGILIPYLGFFLQTGEIHRVLAMVSFPSAFLIFSMKIILGLESFIPDQKQAVKSFLHSVGWQTGFFWHNVSLLTAYLLLAAAVYFQLAFGLAWPVFITLIIAFFLIMQLRRIQQGTKPNWNSLVFTSFLTYFSFVYLLFFGMILR